MTEEHFSQAFQRAFSTDAARCYLPLEERFFALTTLLLRANETTNLTAITDPDAIVSLHYADSLAAAPYLPLNAEVIDVGCGGGFPTLPLAIARPDLQITALDSTAKKLQFVADAAAALSLSNVTVLNARAEEIGRSSAHRGRYTVAISRAVARMQVLCELCLPLVACGGQMIALKGAAAQEELAAAAHGISLLGGALESITAVDLGQEAHAASHHIVVIRKAAETPNKYPRNFSQINKKPL